ncbi:MAG: EamA family transporter [Bryobacteraceae bacterium]
MKWLLVAIVVAATTVSEVWRALGMRRHGEIHDFRPGALGRVLASIVRNRYIIGSVFFAAISFFAFLKLVAMADLSFAVPATAASFVLETILAKYVLKERIGWPRWAGALMVACGVALLSF